MRNANAPVISNSYAYDYGKSSSKVNPNSGVVSLSAFSRFKYDTGLIQSELWPVTTILSNYPLDKLGTKKEVLLRMGAVFYKANKSVDDSKVEIPLFLSVTRRGEAFTNALLTFKTGESDPTTDTDPQFNAEKEYKILKEGGKKLPTKGNYYNDKLVVEKLGQFELPLYDKAEKAKDYLDKNVISIKGTAGKAYESKLAKEGPDTLEQKGTAVEY